GRRAGPPRLGLEPPPGLLLRRLLRPLLGGAARVHAPGARLGLLAAAPRRLLAGAGPASARVVPGRAGAALARQGAALELGVELVALDAGQRLAVGRHPVEQRVEPRPRAIDDLPRHAHAAVLAGASGAARWSRWSRWSRKSGAVVVELNRGPRSILPCRRPPGQPFVLGRRRRRDRSAGGGGDRPAAALAAAAAPAALAPAGCARLAAALLRLLHLHHPALDLVLIDRDRGGR